MSDKYIKRSDARVYVRHAYTKGLNLLLAYIDVIPAADVASVRHGRWIDAYPQKEQNPMFNYGICSICGFEQSISNKLNFCPNCGAKMDKEEDHD